MINNNHWQLAPQSKPALLITQLIVQTRFNQTMKIYNVYLSYYADLHRLRGLYRWATEYKINVSSDSQKTGANLTLMGICTLAGKSLIKGPLPGGFFSLFCHEWEQFVQMQRMIEVLFLGLCFWVGCLSNPASEWLLQPSTRAVSQQEGITSPP